MANQQRRMAPSLENELSEEDKKCRKHHNTLIQLFKEKTEPYKAACTAFISALADPELDRLVGRTWSEGLSRPVREKIRLLVDCSMDTPDLGALWPANGYLENYSIEDISEQTGEIYVCADVSRQNRAQVLELMFEDYIAEDKRDREACKRR
ncbi:hypothetical protein BU26DRAFT_523098 [Trematosphaeria pertusa]|uniref:Uncharacterized protein n=1 Tax=Trematosphaeria pertusa TaxID=390896 RepID=A0A6A6I3C5_9PLEO|nr:uncharacterized protein BU26DRAFT_523098 [Trematosphaeria pertusa]KAF2244452.1 hypothetical protein BU26DRAFT_523098 [Trematosphaeria pertusa]